ncbi:MAG: hypothetical protein Q4C00_08605 [Bacillota bacterium]|nr:hypothetical protein [Bacillota bacterium]
MEEKTKKITALLDHLVHHNEHHAEEIGELAASARELGKEEAATLIEAGVKAMNESNIKLREALEALK